jgi:hypothetical protein
MALAGQRALAPGRRDARAGALALLVAAASFCLSFAQGGVGLGVGELDFLLVGARALALGGDEGVPLGLRAAAAAAGHDAARGASWLLAHCGVRWLRGGFFVAGDG